MQERLGEAIEKKVLSVLKDVKKEIQDSEKEIAKFDERIDDI